MAERCGCRRVVGEKMSSSGATCGGSGIDVRCERAPDPERLPASDARLTPPASVARKRTDPGCSGVRRRLVVPGRPPALPERLAQGPAPARARGLPGPSPPARASVAGARRRKQRGVAGRRVEIPLLALPVPSASSGIRHRRPVDRGGACAEPLAPDDHDVRTVRQLGLRQHRCSVWIRPFRRGTTGSTWITRSPIRA
jgi:hypothetical protein